MVCIYTRVNLTWIVSLCSFDYTINMWKSRRSTPGRTPPFGNPSAEGLSRGPLQILLPHGLLVLRATLTAGRRHLWACRAPRLHLLPHGGGGGGHVRGHG